MAMGVARTRAEVLAANIEDEIETKHLAPGDPFGTLDEIRERSGYARSTVSEAVRLLSDRGVIAIRPGRGGGLFVAEASPVVRLRHMLLTVREKPTPVEHAIAVREALEGLIDVEAARHRTGDDVAELRELLIPLRRSIGAPERWMRANWALHERIALITPNELLRATYLGTTRYIADASVGVVQDGEKPDQEYIELRLAIHVDLVEAIIDGDQSRAAAVAGRHNEPV